MAKKVGRPKGITKPTAEDYVAIRVLKRDAPLLRMAANSTGRTISEMFRIIVDDYVEHKLAADAAAYMKETKAKGGRS
jgi:hypothetical protein